MGLLLDNWSNSQLRYIIEGGLCGCGNYKEIYKHYKSVYNRLEKLNMDMLL